MSSSPAAFSTAPAAITSPPSTSTAKTSTISPISFASASDCSPTLRNANNKKPNLNLLHRIKSSASDSTATINGLATVSSTEEEENPVKIGARVRVKVPLTVYHVPKVSEVDLNGKEGKIKENVAVWKGKNISANFPYKIEFFEVLEGRGDAPVKFFAHLKDDEFEYID